MMAISGGERIYSDSERFDQWDCYCIGCIGGMFHYASMSVGFDFLARFGDRETDVDGRSVSGSGERSPWMFRVYAGFEFWHLRRVVWNVDNMPPFMIVWKRDLWRRGGFGIIR